MHTNLAKDDTPRSPEQGTPGQTRMVHTIPDMPRRVHNMWDQPRMMLIIPDHPRMPRTVHTLPAHAQSRLECTLAQDQVGLFQIHPYIPSTVGPAKMVQRPRYPVVESDHLAISMVQFKVNTWGFKN